ncbi:MAG: HAD hydrolase-like protein, partial [Actinomycetota bacterium]|nr:HAD hydrolase-like protein [Actinomycetota bacterium]
LFRSYTMTRSNALRHAGSTQVKPPYTSRSNHQDPTSPETGARETLAALAADSRVHQAVLSGNLRDVSRIKLEVFGLDSYLDLASSAYGDDHTERSELVAIARHRATERTAATFDKQHTVLIGDTPHDVEAALTAGVRIIAVASGKSDETELAQAGAPVTVSDLTDTATIVQLVTDGLQTSAGQPRT